MCSPTALVPSRQLSFSRRVCLIPVTSCKTRSRATLFSDGAEIDFCDVTRTMMLSWSLLSSHSELIPGKGERERKPSYSPLADRFCNLGVEGGSIEFIRIREWRGIKKD